VAVCDPGGMRRASRPLRPTDPGALLATTHVLAGGECVRLRLARPSDVPRVRAFLERLSPASRARRFLEPTQVDDGLVRRFTFYDPRERLVVAATALVDGREQVVGLGDVTLLETGLAEIGVVVDDARQGRGLGTLLAQAVAALALRRGTTHLRLETLDGRGPGLAVMDRLGRVTRCVEDGRTIVYARIAGATRRAA
jgi:GNAT superfamily N-acetyltransferase